MLITKGAEKMPRRSENIRNETTPHPDGKRENVINDSGLQSPQMGVIVDDDRDQNPFRLSMTNNKDMEEFEQFMRGESLDKGD